jgi:methylated-DNA-[protein]-cysteine S-methyltransferase
MVVIQRSRVPRSPTAAAPSAPCDLVLRTPLGALALWAGDAGLRRVQYVRRAPPVKAQPHPLAVRATRALARYFERGALDDAVPLDLAGCTAFQRRVLLTLAREVGPGSTIPYGDLAARAGRPAAVRAVGTCMARNPLPIFVPCHRVVARGGLGGFGWGLAAKRALLGLERRAAARHQRSGTAGRSGC